jgi:hypothetical protein
VLDRSTAQDDKMALISACYALRRLAANADSRVDDLWPVVVDLIGIELLDLCAWARSAATAHAPLS